MANVGLNTGLKALLTAQTALDNVGHNLANASTPGYSRQHALIAADPAVLVRGLAIGSGVSAQQILRTVDEVLQRRLVLQQASISQLDQRLSGMSQVEALFAEPGDSGINHVMQSFYTALSGLSSNPGDLVQRTGAVQAAQSLTARFNELAAGLALERKQTAGQIAAQVTQANTFGAQIAKLNLEIATFESSGQPANDLRDQRDLALEGLAKLINISAHEGPDGYVTVLTNGALLVGKSKAHQLSAAVAADGSVTIKSSSAPHPIQVSGGSIGGLVHLSETFVPDLLERLNTLAHGLIGASNHAHSQGIPAGGPFQSLKGSHAVLDQDGDGEVTDELLADAGLPFEIGSGSLHVNITDLDDDSFTTAKIAIDPASTTVQDLLDALNAIPHLGASLDSTGRLQLGADEGYGFDFSPRLNPHPDTLGTLGGGAASLGTAGVEPFALADGDTLAIAGPAGSFSVAFDSAQFADITQATAAELAAAINADPATANGGMRAVAQDGHLFLQSLSSGSAASFTLSGGSALSALGWSAGTQATGQDHAVAATLGGEYTGSVNESYTLVPSGDGAIGTTAGLSLEVYDSSGAHVTSLDVGAGYQPGTELSLPNGLKISFGIGSLSATDGDRLTIEALADADAGQALVALGMNSLFEGSDASDIALNQQIALDPHNLAVSGTGAESDNGALQALLDTRDVALEALGGVSSGEYYGSIVSGIGFEIDSTQNAAAVEQLLFDSLQARREQTSGVSMDEELVNMLRFQQAFTAASKFITVVNATNDDILRMI